MLRLGAARLSESTAAAARNDELWSGAYGEMQALGPVHRHMRRLLAGLLADLEYRTAIDVGCGAGDNAELLGVDAMDRWVGVDVSQEALARAQRRAPGDYRSLDVQVERVDEQFDLVFSSLLLEHLPDDAAALRNMRAMCRRWLVVSTMAGDFERYRAWEDQVGHVRNYSRGELEARLRDAGFEVVSARYWGFPFYSPVARILQNRTSPSPEFSRATRLVAAALYWLYSLNSTRRGDLLIVLARPVQADAEAAAIESSSVREGE